MDIYDYETFKRALPRASGPNLIQTGGLSNGIQSVIDRILERSQEQGRIAVLRFLAHGGYGAFGVSGGSNSLRGSDGKTLYHCKPSRRPGPQMLESSSCGVGHKNKKGEMVYTNTVHFDPWLEQAAISLRPTTRKDPPSFDLYKRRVIAELARLQGRLEPYATVELHGCFTGAGHDGDATCTKISSVLGVPVVAGQSFQALVNNNADPATDEHVPRMEPPIRYWYPGGGSLESWVKTLQPTTRAARPGRG